MNEKSEKIKSIIRLEIAAKIISAIASNPNFKGEITCFKEYIIWADRLIEENEKLKKQETT